MATVTIRNLDEGVLASLKARARRNNRSLEGELRDLLAEAAHAPARDEAELASRMRDLSMRIRAGGGNTPGPDSTDTLAELRAARQAGLAANSSAPS